VSAEPWTADNQKDYDRAVHHAQIVERTGKEVYRPFQGMFDHEAAKVQKKFVGRFVGLMKTLEPTYMAEALQWARSNDSRENPILTPIVDSLADPMITDLNDEAEVRVDRAVKGIAQKQGLSLPEKEKLRAHLMAPLKTRILNRVHSQVYDYVTRMARSVVLTAANMTASGSNEAVAALEVEYLEDRSLPDAVARLAVLRVTGIWTSESSIPPLGLDVLCQHGHDRLSPSPNDWGEKVSKHYAGRKLS